MKRFYLLSVLALLGLMLAAWDQVDSLPIDVTAAVQVAVEATRERPYRNHPPPTGFPGFRRYYQIRCYPGCHSYGTPTPDRVHPWSDVGHRRAQWPHGILPYVRF